MAWTASWELWTVFGLVVTIPNQSRRRAFFSGHSLFKELYKNIVAFDCRLTWAAHCHWECEKELWKLDETFLFRIEHADHIVNEQLAVCPEKKHLKGLFHQFFKAYTITSVLSVHAPFQFLACLVQEKN